MATTSLSGNRFASSSDGAEAASPWFARLSLSQQFLLASFPIMLAATLGMGWWVGDQVEESVVRRTGAVTALYVDSFVAPHVQTLASRDDLTDADRGELAR